mgnify:CR=1 FL=1
MSMVLTEMVNVKMKKKMMMMTMLMKMMKMKTLNEVEGPINFACSAACLPYRI